jgi:hypothetical protein
MNFFQTLLKLEAWEFVYIDKYSNHMFNSFLCTFFNIFRASFLVEHKSVKDKNDLITQGTKNTLQTYKKFACLH